MSDGLHRDVINQLRNEMRLGELESDLRRLTAAHGFARIRWRKWLAGLGVLGCMYLLADAALGGMIIKYWTVPLWHQVNVVLHTYRVP